MTISFSASATGPMFLWRSTNLSRNQSRPKHTSCDSAEEEASCAHEERHCSAKYLRLFKTVNVVGKSAKKISVIMLTQAQSLIELLAGRRLKHVQSTAVAEEVESTAMETEDGSSSDGISTLACAAPMQSEINLTENPQFSVAYSWEPGRSNANWTCTRDYNSGIRSSDAVWTGPYNWRLPI